MNIAEKIPKNTNSRECSSSMAPELVVTLAAVGVVEDDSARAFLEGEEALLLIARVVMLDPLKVIEDVEVVG